MFSGYREKIKREMFVARLVSSSSSSFLDGLRHRHTQTTHRWKSRVEGTYLDLQGNTQLSVQPTDRPSVRPFLTQKERERQKKEK